MLGILLAICGTVALVSPAFTVGTTYAAVLILGIVLMVAGMATIITAFWAGKWSGMLLQLLVGILYLGGGAGHQGKAAAAALTVFIASMFIVVGALRGRGAGDPLPSLGLGMLNGMVTLIFGIVIYRDFPEASTWLIGVLVGVEMLFRGGLDHAFAGDSRIAGRTGVRL